MSDLTYFVINNNVNNLLIVIFIRYFQIALIHRLHYTEIQLTLLLFRFVQQINCSLRHFIYFRVDFTYRLI